MNLRAFTATALITIIAIILQPEVRAADAKKQYEWQQEQDRLKEQWKREQMRKSHAAPPRTAAHVATGVAWRAARAGAGVANTGGRKVGVGFASATLSRYHTGH